MNQGAVTQAGQVTRQADRIGRLVETQKDLLERLWHKLACVIVDSPLAENAGKGVPDTDGMAPLASQLCAMAEDLGADNDDLAELIERIDL